METDAGAGEIAGVVFDIQRFCIHDGPGLRTTVFLKGCPLACRWCSNPESQSSAPELFHNADRCMQCGACVTACPSGAIGNDIHIDRNICLACGGCETVCPMAALVVKGREMSPSDVLAEVEKDRPFYISSGGGATVSGGEPFAQPDFLFSLLSAFKTAGIATAIETSLHAKWDDIDRCLPFLDHLIVDVKHFDSSVHEEWTGRRLDSIRRNIEYLLSRRVAPLFRIPVIPGFNSSHDDAEEFADYFEELGIRKVELLPYHIFGEGKYGMLNRDYPGAAIPTEEAGIAADRLCGILHKRGIEASIGG